MLSVQTDHEFLDAGLLNPVLFCLFLYKVIFDLSFKMTANSNIYEEYSNNIQQLSSKVIDDIANAEFLKDISEVDLNRIIKKTELKVEKISQKEIEQYESGYRIKIPAFIKFIVTEIGQSDLVCFWFFRDNQIEKPLFYFSYDFFHACLKRGLSSDYLNDFDFDSLYEIDTNTFKDVQIQEVYKELNCNDDKCIIKLLPTGHGDCSGLECVVLNEVNNGLVVYTVNWQGKVHNIESAEYFQYDYRTNGVQIEDYCKTFLQNRLITTLTLEDLIAKEKSRSSLLRKIFKW